MTRWLPVLLLLAACGRERPVADGDPAAVFPHPAGYLADHGADALATDPGCETCHALAGTSTGPSCGSCHPDYPHDAEMSEGAVHGGRWADSSSACQACHGDSGSRAPGGLASATCTGCHSTYPHPAEFSSAARHGASVVHHGGPAPCVSCHGDQFDDIGPGRCHACHAAYPHLAPQWASAEGHGAAYLAGTSCGTACHATQDPLWTARCDTCHDEYPHDDGWTTGHLQVVQARGEQPCQQCHPSGSLQGPDIPVDCTESCHGGAP